MIFFSLLPILGTAYSLWRIWQMLPLSASFKAGIVLLLALSVVLLFVNFGVGLDRIPMSAAIPMYEIGTSSIFILLYVVMLFLLLDIGRLVHIVPQSLLVNSVKGSLGVLILITGIFVYGNIHYRNKMRQPIELITTKPLQRPLKIVMMSDLHLGYHNRKAEFARWVKLVNTEKPDLILIAGDIIDVSVRPLMEEKVWEEFRKLRAPVFACLGNHEYYSGDANAERFFRESGIQLLRDSVATINGINIIGRDDRTNLRRKRVAQLMARVDTSRYTILLDHQPYQLEEAELAGVDFQLSGHTHYGQVWPISWIEDAIYEDAYGPWQRGKTQYFVTSGIGIWGGKFRIGTRSEYLVAELHNK